MMKWLRQRNDALKSAAARRVSDDCPASLGTFFINPESMARASFLAEGLSAGTKVLVIGDAYGREYFHLAARGCEVTAVDLGASAVVPDVVIADASSHLPFADKSFDAVIAAEVIEHLIEDTSALREIHRVLRPSGSLRITVPFFHDPPEFHVRVHTPLTIRRLLQATGFEVAETRYVGLLVPLESVERLALRAVGTFACAVAGDRRGADLATFFVMSTARMHLWAGHLPRLWHEVGGRHRYRFGCLLRARPAGSVDFVALNRQQFVRAK